MDSPRRCSPSLFVMIALLGQCLGIFSPGRAGAYDATKPTGRGPGTHSKGSVASADFIFDFDLIFEGTVLAAANVQRARLGGCTAPSPSIKPLVDYSVRLDRLIQGVATSETLKVTQLDITGHELDGTGPGARVLVYGFHDCRDGWHISAGVAPRALGQDGYTVEVLHPAGNPDPGYRFRKVPDVLLNSIAARAARRDRSVAAGDQGIGLFVVTGSEFGRTEAPAPGRVSVAPVGTLGVLSPLRIREVKGTWDLRCRAGLQLGDTLALPIRSSDSGRKVLLFPYCIERFKLEAGHIRYVGMQLEEVRSQFSRTGELPRVTLPVQ